MDIAICIPYFERKAALLKTIKTFEKMGYFSGKPYKIEFCICDDGSINEPISEEDFREPVKVIALPKKSAWMTPCVPLNTAIRATTAPVIVIQSPETYHEMPVIYNMASKMTSYKDVVNARCKTHKGRLRGLTFIWWCQMFSRKFFEELGGFNEEYREYSAGEDNDMEFRMTLAGCNWKWADKGQYVVHGTETPKTNRTELLGKDKLHKEYSWDTIGKIRKIQKGAQ